MKVTFYEHNNQIKQNTEKDVGKKKKEGEREKKKDFKTCR